jgi:hypothetical protein
MWHIKWGMRGGGGGGANNNNQKPQGWVLCQNPKCRYRYRKAEGGRREADDKEKEGEGEGECGLLAIQIHKRNHTSTGLIADSILIVIDGDYGLL